MIRPDAQTIEALARIGSTHDGALMLKWVEASRNDAVDSLMSTHEVHLMHRGQGAIKELSNITKTFIDAKEIARLNR